jgi:type I restriction enzyme S subunit
MVGYQIYPKYINSGVAWMGDVPEHWVPIRFKHRLLEKKKVSNSGLDAGSISFGRVIFKVAKNLAPETKASYQEVIAGEFLINPLNMNYDLLSLRTALSAIDVVVSTGYIVIRSEDNLVKRYVRWLLQEFDVAHMKTLGSGVRQTINYMDIGNSFFYEPPKDEQQKIANFLDHETAKIDTLVDKQQQLITLLKEKRQAVISHAVTKGLNPKAPMRDSGVEWLGEVPEHWTVSRIKNVVTKIVDGPHFSPKYHDEGYMFISARNIKVDRWSLDDAKYVSEADFNEFNRRVRPEMGDVLLTKGGTTGVARAVDLDFPFQVWVHVAVLKTIITKVDPFYLAYVLNGTSCYEQSQQYTFGATNNDLGLSRIAKIFFALPSMEEQIQIRLCLDNESKKFDDLIAKSITSIGLMQERSTALISAAVTGKIDVRNWQVTVTTNNHKEVAS